MVGSSLDTHVRENTVAAYVGPLGQTVALGADCLAEVLQPTAPGGTGAGLVHRPSHHMVAFFSVTVGFHSSLFTTGLADLLGSCCCSVPLHPGP